MSVGDELTRIASVRAICTSWFSAWASVDPEALLRVYTGEVMGDSTEESPMDSMGSMSSSSEGWLCSGVPSILLASLVFILPSRLPNAEIGLCRKR